MQDRKTLIAYRKAAAAFFTTLERELFPPDGQQQVIEEADALKAYQQQTMPQQRPAAPIAAPAPTPRPAPRAPRAATPTPAASLARHAQQPKPLPTPLTPGRNSEPALTDEQRAANLPDAVEVAKRIISVMGPNLPTLREGVKGQLALQRIPHDEQLLSEAIDAAKRG